MPLKAFVADAPHPLICPGGYLLPAGEKGSKLHGDHSCIKGLKRARDAATTPLLPSGEKMPAGR
ncbi:hypothetical protein CO650_13950 [Rhizobium phaseoli]|nr:hypothetical protein CO650_13950 [Rhizobium phaseoli]